MMSNFNRDELKTLLQKTLFPPVNYGYRRQMESDEKVCRVCTVTLGPHNWSRTMAESSNYICKDCHGTQVKRSQAKSHVDFDKLADLVISLVAERSAIMAAEPDQTLVGLTLEGDRQPTFYVDLEKLATITFDLNGREAPPASEPCELREPETIVRIERLDGTVVEFDLDDLDRSGGEE